SNIYVDTLVSPSFTSSVAQIIQLPGVAGTENNLLIFEFSKNKPDRLVDIIDNFKLTRSVDFDMLILGSSERGYGLKQQIHIWITANDYHNANLMILLAYIILGHRDWSKGQIKIFAVYPEDTIQDEKERLFRLIEAGQLPISPNNIELITQKQELSVRSIVNEKSQDADLTIIGFREEMVKHAGKEIFEDYEAVGNVLFVNTAE
ncbi:MAG: amino acid permease, partial [Saprospiraceae bacterium]|nr:amino acid permease [Saprospiraceae bacterium]